MKILKVDGLSVKRWYFEISVDVLQNPLLCSLGVVKKLGQATNMWETMDFENRKEFSLDKKLINQDNCYSLKFSTISIHNNGTNTERESKNVDRSVFCYKTVSMSDSLS